MKTRIGRKLTEARECLDLTIEDMAILTRIPAKTIIQMENDDYSLFPNNVYAKSFIKLYCKCLKINSTKYIHEIEDLLPSHDQKAIYLDGAAASNDFRRLEEEKIETSSPMSLAAAMTLLLMGIPFIILINGNKSQNTNKVNPELYAPAKIDSITDPEEESFAGIKSLKNKQGASQDSLKSTGPSQKNKDEIKETKSAPKAIPVEKNATTRQPIVSSSFE